MDEVVRRRFWEDDINLSLANTPGDSPLVVEFEDLNLDEFGECQIR